jgi:hypothetical protein
LSKTRLGFFYEGLVGAVLAAILTFFLLRRFSPKEDLVSHAKNALLALLVGLLIPSFIFSSTFTWKLVTAVYDDHTDNIARLNYVIAERDKLKKGILTRDAYIQQLEKNQRVVSVPQPTDKDRMVVATKHLTADERTDLSRALHEFEESLKAAQELSDRMTNSLDPIGDLRNIPALGKQIGDYQTSFVAMYQARLRYFKDQVEYIFGNNPVGEISRLSDEVTDTYPSYLSAFQFQRPESPAQFPVQMPKADDPNYRVFQGYISCVRRYVGEDLRPYRIWHDGAVKRIDDVRDALHQ